MAYFPRIMKIKKKISKYQNVILTSEFRTAFFHDNLKLISKLLIKQQVNEGVNCTVGICQPHNKLKCSVLQYNLMYTVQTDKDKEGHQHKVNKTTTMIIKVIFFAVFTASACLAFWPASPQGTSRDNKREHTIECKTVMAKTGTEKLNTKTQKPDMLLAENWEKSITQNVASSFHENLFCHGNHASYRRDRPLPNHSNDKRNMEQYGRQM